MDALKVTLYATLALAAIAAPSQVSQAEPEPTKRDGPATDNQATRPDLNQPITAAPNVAPPAVVAFTQTALPGKTPAKTSPKIGGIIPDALTELDNFPIPANESEAPAARPAAPSAAAQSADTPAAASGSPTDSPPAATTPAPPETANESAISPATAVAMPAPHPVAEPETATTDAATDTDNGTATPATPATPPRPTPTVEATGPAAPGTLPPVPSQSANAGGGFSAAPPPMVSSGPRDDISHVRLMAPVANTTPVSSGFGWRTHPIHGDRRFHTGIDFAAPQGTPVLAAAPGRVIAADWRGGYGLAIEIEHDHGAVRTFYAHLSQNYVQAGDQVSQGQPIGTIGSTGSSTGPHLHFEVLRPTIQGWVAIDPMTQLASATRYAQAQAVTASVSAANRPIPNYSVAQIKDLKVTAMPVANSPGTRQPQLSGLASRPQGGASPAPVRAPLPPTLPAQERFNNLDIDDVEYWTDLCTTLSEAGQWTEAIAACDRALALEPDALDIWLMRGQALEAQGQYTEALANYGYVLSRADRHSEALSYQCRVFGQLGNVEAALKVCDRALRIDRRWGQFSPAATWHLRGQILAQDEQFSQALNSLARSLRLQPDQSAVFVSQAQIHLALAEYETVLVDTEKALSVNQDWQAAAPAQARQLQAQALVALDLPEDAIAVYDQALATDLNNADLWLAQAQLLYDQGRFQDALTAYAEVVNLQPNSSAALLGQAATHNELQQYDLALQAIDQATQGDGNWGDLAPAFIWDQRAQALGGLGQYEAALAVANRAVGLEPDYAPAWNNRAVILWHLEDYDAALASVMQAIETDVSYAQAWFNRGRILSSMENYAAALVAYDEALSLDADNPDFWINRGVVLWKSSRAEAALASLERAFSLDQNSYQAKVNQGIILIDLENYSEAVQAFTQASEINPSSAAAWLGRGTALLRLDRRAEADVAFTRAASLQGESTQPSNPIVPVSGPPSALNSYPKSELANPDSIK